MTHPAPVVVQVEITALQALSDVNVIGSDEQVYGLQVVVEASQAQVGVVAPKIGLLLQSDAVVYPPQVDGFDLHSIAKSQYNPLVDL